MELNKGKVAVLSVLLVGSAYYGITKYRSLTPNKSINNGVTDEFRRRPTKEITPQRRQQFESELGITPDQQKKLEALRSQGGDNWRDRMSSMSAILTPEQREKMRAMRTARQDATVKKAVSPGQFQQYQQKRDQLMQQRRANPGNGQGRNGGGGGPR